MPIGESKNDPGRFFAINFRLFSFFIRFNARIYLIEAFRYDFYLFIRNPDFIERYRMTTVF